ncbi:MAG: hypothetical protein V4710_10150, partial [Verrucomicrobiota bacterium]
MIDDLHNDLLTNIAFLMERYRDTSPVVAEALEPLFIGALEYLADREDLLSEGDLHTIGKWLNECEQYFADYNFRLVRFVLSREPNRSGRQERDISGFVSRVFCFRRNSRTEVSKEATSG